MPLPPKREITQQESISISRFWTSDEAYKIKRFVERREWNAVQTESGLYYYIFDANPKAKQAKPGDEVLIKYEIRLLDADTTLCYASAPNQTETVLIEMDNIEAGLHEGLAKLREGEKAFIILPHYLAHGLVGDLDKIPPLSPVLYKIELVKIKENE